MQLLDEIIDLAVDNSASVSVLLRKCLVLAHTLKNERLKTWVEKELDGYDNEDELPEYRRVEIVAKGVFVGPLVMINDQPLAACVLEPKHQHFAREARLMQPIAAYEMKVEGQLRIAGSSPARLRTCRENAD
jgi:AbiTii